MSFVLTQTYSAVLIKFSPLLHSVHMLDHLEDIMCIAHAGRSIFMPGIGLRSLFSSSARFLRSFEGVGERKRGKQYSSYVGGFA